MIIKVQYTTQLKAAIGVAEEAIELSDGSTLADLVQTLSVRHEQPFRQLVLSGSGQLLPSILLCVDDEQVEASDGRGLADGSVVTFLSAISGG